MNAPSNTNALEAPGFGEYFSIVRKRRRLLLSFAVPIVALALMLALGLPDAYRSTGLVEIEGAQSNPRNTRDGEESPYADQYVQSLSTVVLGDKNLRRLLKEHKLYDDQAAEPDVGKVRRGIDVDIVTVPILDPQSGREREVVTAFTVAYENADPQRAQQGAAWLVDAYLSENRRDRQESAASTAKFFAAEAERMRTHVSDLERKLADFKSKNVGRLPELTGVNLNVMDRTEGEIQNIESQMQALRRERVFLAAQLQQARSVGPEAGTLRALEAEYDSKRATYDESHPDLISLRRQIDTLRRGGSTTGMSLRAQLQNQQAILSEARQRYSDDHPDVKRIARNIESLEARLAAGETADRSVASDSPMATQLQTQLNATDTQLAALQARGMELRAKMTTLESRIDAAPEVEREYQMVTRDLAGAREKFEELLRRQMDAEVSESAIAGGTADKFKVTSAPTIPKEPAKPRRMAILIVGLILGAMAGITAVIAAQLFDQSVRGTMDVREVLGVLPLCAVPDIENSGSSAIRRRYAVAFVMRTVIGVGAVYYVISQFVL